MTELILTPTVDQAQEFIEIANDFANPLDLVREAISNAFDAHATEIRLAFETEVVSGETTFVIRITDNGDGMTREGLQSFFDLGNSTLSRARISPNIATAKPFDAWVSRTWRNAASASSGRPVVLYGTHLGSPAAAPRFWSKRKPTSPRRPRLAARPRRNHSPISAARSRKPGPGTARAPRPTGPALSTSTPTGLPSTTF